MNVAVFFWKLKKAHEDKYQKDKKEGEEDSHHEKGKDHHHHHHHRHGQEKRSKKSEKHTKKSENHSKRSEKHTKRSEKRTKKTEKCTRKLKKACDQDLTNYCPTVNNNLRDMKFCLMNKFTSISTNCQEYLLNSKNYRKEPKTGQKESIPEAIEDSSSGSEISTDSSEMVAEIGV